MKRDGSPPPPPSSSSFSHLVQSMMLTSLVREQWWEFQKMVGCSVALGPWVDNNKARLINQDPRSLRTFEVLRSQHQILTNQNKRGLSQWTNLFVIVNKFSWRLVLLEEPPANCLAVARSAPFCLQTPVVLQDWQRVLTCSQALCHQKVRKNIGDGDSHSL